MDAPLPVIDGVSPSSQWLPAGPWKTVLEFLIEHFARVETTTWLARMARGELLDERGQRLNAASAYRAGACIFYYRELETEERIPFTEQVLYQDENILIADKPHFLPVIPAGRFLHETLLVRLKKKLKLEELVPVHRLDRETAGLVLFSVNAATRGRYTALFRNRQVTKVYEAFAPTRSDLTFPIRRRSRIVPGEPFFRMQEVAGESNSETYLDVLKGASRVDGASLYQLQPSTGRKHQLRVHLSALKIPIINDRLYPEVSSPSDAESSDPFSSPLKLLAKSIAFQDPLTGQERYFVSERKVA